MQKLTQHNMVLIGYPPNTPTPFNSEVSVQTKETEKGAEVTITTDIGEREAIYSHRNVWCCVGKFLEVFVTIVTMHHCRIFMIEVYESLLGSIVK